MDDKKIRPNEPDLLQSTRAVYEEFLSDLSEEQKCETVNDLTFLYMAFGMHECFYLDQWNLSFWHKFDQSLNDWIHDKETKNRTRAAAHKYARFVHEKMPFEQGLPF